MTIPRSIKYRLYVDEVGNADLRASKDPNHRYLSLSGVIMELGYVDSAFAPQMEDLKRRYFETHVDEPLILHRKELFQKNYPFQALRDPEVERRFDKDLLTALEEWQYQVITIVIDKHEHLQRYQVWRYDPYHYCMEVLLERYVQWLKRQSAQGDVMAEARDSKQDARLKKSFNRIYDEGSDYVDSALFSQHLTSSQLKLRSKGYNIAGLQLADLIAHPSFQGMLARRSNQALPGHFGGVIAKILEGGKYLQSPSGKAEGWGQKWLP